METLITKLKNTYKSYIEKGIVVIQVPTKDRTYNVTIDIESFSIIASFNSLKANITSGKRNIVTYDNDGNQHFIHRLIAGANENEEVVILNGDFTDLRLINLKKVPKGTGRLLESKEKERIARNIKPISEIMTELENNNSTLNKEDRDAATSLSPLDNFDIAPSLFSNKVAVQFQNHQFTFENLSSEEKGQLIELLSLIKNSKTL